MSTYLYCKHAVEAKTLNKNKIWHLVSEPLSDWLLIMDISASFVSLDSRLDCMKIEECP